MKPSISRKMDMVKDVFLNNKRLQEHLLSVEDWVLDNHSDIFIDEFIPERQLLIEDKSKKKVSNKKICRIKNNKGEFVDIKKIRNTDKKDDTNLLELPPPEGDENLISIGNQMTIPESLRLLEKVKRGKKKFRDFYRNTDTEFYKPKFVRKETEEILF
tara:strand:+ start:41 stop:514 length:474 start_codon:yes stop_codon:yes gene_type:complete